MSTRYVKEYCPHCREEVWCTFKGWSLYCDGHDHFVRDKRTAKRTTPAPTNMYENVKEHMSDTFHDRGRYTWAELAEWCRRAHFTDLEALCRDMMQLDTAA